MSLTSFRTAPIADIPLERLGEHRFYAKQPTQAEVEQIFDALEAGKANGLSQEEVLRGFTRDLYDAHKAPTGHSVSVKPVMGDAGDLMTFRFPSKAMVAHDMGGEFFWKPVKGSALHTNEEGQLLDMTGHPFKVPVEVDGQPIDAIYPVRVQTETGDALGYAFPTFVEQPKHSNVNQGVYWQREPHTRELTFKGLPVNDDGVLLATTPHS